MMFQQKIRKAVFPVAGLGTRFLPATKASPKEMLPIVDKPLIQYAVEEAVAAGCTELVFITGRSKRSIEDHFDKAYELETELQLRHKDHLLAQVQNVLPANVKCTYIRQAEALGLGHAVLCAQPAIGDEPFAVILADDLIDAPKGALSQLLETYQKLGSSVVGVQTIDHSQTQSYGMVETLQWQDMQRIHHMVEKPKPEETASNLAVVGRYILTPRIFDLLRSVQRGAGGEIQLTDAIAKLLEYEPVIACPFEGVRFDCGSKLGYLEAMVAYGLKHPETGVAFKELVQRYATDNGAMAAVSPAVALPVQAALSVPASATAIEDEDDDEWVTENESTEEELPVSAEGVAQLISMLNSFMEGANLDEDDVDDDEEDVAPISMTASETSTEQAAAQDAPSETTQPETEETTTPPSEEEVAAPVADDADDADTQPEKPAEDDADEQTRQLVEDSIQAALEEAALTNGTTVSQPENDAEDKVAVDVSAISKADDIPELKEDIAKDYVVEAPSEALKEDAEPSKPDATAETENNATTETPASGFQSLGGQYAFGSSRFVTSNNRPANLQKK